MRLFFLCKLHFNCWQNRSKVGGKTTGKGTNDVVIATRWR